MNKKYSVNLPSEKRSRQIPNYIVENYCFFTTNDNKIKNWTNAFTRGALHLIRLGLLQTLKYYRLVNKTATVFTPSYYLHHHT